MAAIAFSALTTILFIWLVAVIRHYRRQLVAANQNRRMAWRFYRELQQLLEQTNSQSQQELDRAWQYNAELQQRLKNRAVWWDAAEIGYVPTIYRN
jgi:hypothetical protein